MLLRAYPHYFLLAECNRCGFMEEGEVKNGHGGWRNCDWDAFIRTCTHRTPAGAPTMVCPHLRAAKLAAEPLNDSDFQRLHAGCGRENAPGLHVEPAVAPGPTAPASAAL